jgi:hypothetical protein
VEKRQKEGEGREVGWGKVETMEEEIQGMIFEKDFGDVCWGILVEKSVDERDFDVLCVVVKSFVL